MQRTIRAAAIAALVLVAVACGGMPTPTPQRETLGMPLPPIATYGPGSCRSTGDLPDPLCTPGAIQQGVTAATLCAPGYTTRDVRPSARYTDALERSQMAAYGFTDATGLHEEDHLIPLELAGSPVDARNLWPQPHAGNDGAALGSEAKDRVENALHRQVCNSTIALAEAQREIATDWTQVYRAMQARGLVQSEPPNAPTPTSVA